MLPEEWTAFPDLLILYAILCAHTREGERAPRHGRHAGSHAGRAVGTGSGCWERTRRRHAQNAAAACQKVCARASMCRGACAQLSKYSWVRTATRDPLPGQNPLQQLGWLLLLSCTPTLSCSCSASPAPCADRRRGDGVLVAAPRTRSPARFPVSPSALPSRLQSRALLPVAARSLAATQCASPPPPALAPSVHSRASLSRMLPRRPWQLGRA